MYEDSLTWFMTKIIVGSILAIALISVVVRQVDRHYEVNNCRTYAVVTDRQTKFVDFNYFNFKCMTPTQNGKWIGTDQLREF